MSRANENGAGASKIGYELIFRRLLLIYQMPKTGSQTVEASLQECLLPHTILRFHFLSAIRAQELKRASPPEHHCIASIRTQEGVQFMEKLTQIIRIRNLLRACKIGVPRLEIITAVREPIGLGLAAIFENYRSFAPNLRSMTPELCSQVLQAYPGMLKSLEAWFERELKPMTGIDVYEQPFPHEKGYTIYENRFARVLVYRFEALSQLATMVREFLGFENLSIISRNIGSAKEYGTQYTCAKTNLCLAGQFITAHCNSRLMRHFYNDEERRNLEHKWRREELQVC